MQHGLVAEEDKQLAGSLARGAQLDQRFARGEKAWGSTCRYRWTIVSTVI